MKNAYSEADFSSYDEELQKTIEQIGIARFVGRINSGIIPADKGYAAVDQFVARAKQRPLLSKLTYMVLGRVDTYAHR